MFLEISNPGSIVYPEKFKAGDKAKVTQFVEFMDGTYHFVGQIVDVTADNKAYFNVFHSIHEKMDNTKIGGCHPHSIPSQIADIGD